MFFINLDEFLDDDPVFFYLLLILLQLDDQLTVIQLLQHIFIPIAGHFTWIIGLKESVPERSLSLGMFIEHEYNQCQEVSLCIVLKERLMAIEDKPDLATSRSLHCNQ